MDEARNSGRSEGGAGPRAADGFDLLAVPVVGALLKRRATRTAARVVGLLLSAVMIAHGLFGPELAPKNLATVLGWVHLRGLLVLGLLVAGNLFCAACPFVQVRDWARKLVAPARIWPRALRTKWLSIGLFVLVLFSYELFDLWGSPFWTAWLILAYFAGALVVDTVFQGASFCKWVCPIGQFNFVASTVSPLEVKVREHGVCDSCRTKDCIKGRRDPVDKLVVIQRGCELALFQPRKAGNLDCTFCLDCVYACPHDNVGIVSRPPASELFTDPRRSGVGRVAERPDLGALALVFAFGALLNAFGMVSPVYAVESWLSAKLGISHEAPILALLFAFALVVEPAVLVGAAAWATRALARPALGFVPIASRYALALAPMGFGVWLAHYAFHFLAGLLTFVPVAQNALVEIGAPLLGAPRWSLVGIPAAYVFPAELGLLGLGTLGSLIAAWGVSEDVAPGRAARAFAPWAILCGLLFAAALWLLSQPMEMRGTILARADFDRTCGTAIEAEGPESRRTPAAPSIAPGAGRAVGEAGTRGPNGKRVGAGRPAGGTPTFRRRHGAARRESNGGVPPAVRPARRRDARAHRVPRADARFTRCYRRGRRRSPALPTSGLDRRTLSRRLSGPPASIAEHSLGIRYS